MKVKFKRFSSHARLPTKKTPGSACFEVYSSRSVTLEPGVRRPIETDFGLKFSKEHIARLYFRSILSLKPVYLGGGVMDYDFRGNISIIFDKSFAKNISIEISIETGDRIAQMIFLKKRTLILLE